MIPIGPWGSGWLRLISISESCYFVYRVPFEDELVTGADLKVIAHKVRQGDNVRTMLSVDFSFSLPIVFIWSGHMADSITVALLVNTFLDRERY